MGVILLITGLPGAVRARPRIPFKTVHDFAPNAAKIARRMRILCQESYNASGSKPEKG